MVDGGFKPAPTNTALQNLADEVHIAGRQENGSRRTRRRQRYRTGAEGRVSHLKRGYGLRRSRLKGDEGHQIWDGWAAFTYNADTYLHHPPVRKQPSTRRKWARNPEGSSRTDDHPLQPTSQPPPFLTGQHPRRCLSGGK